MDISLLDTRAASDAGVWFDLVDLEGRPLSDEKGPLKLRIAGKDSAVAKQVLSDIAEAPEGAEVAPLIAPILLEWTENVELGGKLPVTRENAVKILSFPHFQDFVLSKSSVRANFSTAALKA